MEKGKYFQLELFSAGQDLTKKQNPELLNSFLVYLGRYEKTILVVIGFIITAVFSFCLGVERQKKISRSQLNFDIVGKTELKLSEPKTRQDRKVVQDQAVKQAKCLSSKGTDLSARGLRPTLQPIGNEARYTIQVASYSNKTFAERESERLKKRGFSVLILSKDSYIAVCVGNFSDKKRAKSFLSQLRQNYRDCYIRRL